MSAMSASPVKPPVLPPSGVNVTPPVATSPAKVGIMPIPSTLTIAPTKPPNMNHTAMPLSLIADHKMAPQFPTQSQTGAPPAMQPISQPLPRTPEKPKDLLVPVPLPVPAKPTSNGMEGLPPSNPPLPTPAPALPEAQLSAAPPPSKVDPPAPTEIPDSKPTLPENASEPLVSNTAPPLENAKNETEKKDDLAVLKPVEPVNEVAKAPSAPSVPTPPQPETPSTTAASGPAPAAPAPAPAPVPASAPATVPAPPTPTPPAVPAPAPVAPPAEQPTVTPSVSRSESSVPHSKPELKVATIPRQAAKRKREPKAAPPSTEVKKEGKEDDRKSKRVRLPTQPYQSPIPELNIIAKISKSTKATPTKAADDKLIVFYKNEFLAVRNAEGGFYVCQAMQNIYKSSPRIRIRWLSQTGGKDTYSPDFYDHTDFDCILTNLNLDKVDKDKFRLPLVEQQRTESILKRALDVEKGVSEKPPVTEEHPDGLDLSLFRDESQLKKSSKSRSRSGKKSGSVKSEDEDSSGEEKDEDDDDDEEEEEEAAAADEKEEENNKKESVTKPSRKKKKSVKKKPPAEKKSAAKTATIASSSSKSTVQPAKKKTETRVGSKRKSSVSSNTQPAEKRSRASSQPSDRTNKTRSAEATAGVKSQRDRRAKSRK